MHGGAEAVMTVILSVVRRNDFALRILIENMPMHMAVMRFLHGLSTIVEHGSHGRHRLIITMMAGQCLCDTGQHKAEREGQDPYLTRYREEISEQRKPSYHKPRPLRSKQYMVVFPHFSIGTLIFSLRPASARYIGHWMSSNNHRPLYRGGFGCQSHYSSLAENRMSKLSPVLGVLSMETSLGSNIPRPGRFHATINARQSLRAAFPWFLKLALEER